MTQKCYNILKVYACDCELIEHSMNLIHRIVSNIFVKPKKAVCGGVKKLTRSTVTALNALVKTLRGIIFRAYEVVFVGRYIKQRGPCPNAKINLVVFFEGTGNEPERNPSAMTRLRDMLVDDINQGQILHLIKGSGTHGCWVLRKICGWIGADSLWIVGKQFRWLRKFRYGVPSDTKINLYVFGFSRGAYQARVFVNVLKLFRYKVTIRYLGIIDTVRAGLPIKIGWMYSIPKEVQICRHAIAIHEYRKKFMSKVINKDRVLPNVEERWFLGCHSDVGWAYNGKRYEFEYILGIKKRCFARRVNRAKSQAYGKIALSWLVDPVANVLNFKDVNARDTVNVLGYEHGPQNLLDYINLCCYHIYLLHNPTFEISNLWGCFRPRIRNPGVSRRNIESRLHFSADAVRLIFKMRQIQLSLNCAQSIVDAIELRKHDRNLSNWPKSYRTNFSRVLSRERWNIWAMLICNGFRIV